MGTKWIGPGVLAWTLALFASPVAADEPAHPDLSGFWNLAFGQSQPSGPDADALRGKLPADTVLLDDTGAKEYPQGEYGGLKPTEVALAKAREWTPAVEMTLQRVCAAPSIIYTEQGPFPFEIYQTPQLIVFKYEYFDQVRLIFMDGREHLPADAPHSKTGDSIGHWEGDELVIDTTHLAAATLTNNGLDHSDNVRLVERYRLSPDGKRLVALQWFEDPEMIENRGARIIEWQKHPGEHVFPYDCDPSLAVEYSKTAQEDAVGQ